MSVPRSKTVDGGYCADILEIGPVISLLVVVKRE